MLKLFNYYNYNLVKEYSFICIISFFFIFSLFVQCIFNLSEEALINISNENPKSRKTKKKKKKNHQTERSNKSHGGAQGGIIDTKRYAPWNVIDNNTPRYSLNLSPHAIGCTKMTKLIKLLVCRLIKRFVMRVYTQSMTILCHYK